MAPKKKLDAERLWDYALKSLSVRAQSSGQLREKLRNRAEKQEDIPAILARLREYGYLDDNRFAEGFATARLENAGLGRARVLSDLRGKRVPPVVAERAVNGAYADTDEIELIENYVRRKYQSVEREGLFRADKDLAAAYNRLRRAGFSSGNTIRVLKRFAAHPDLLDAIEGE